MGRQGCVLHLRDRGGQTLHLLGLQIKKMKNMFVSPTSHRAALSSAETEIKPVKTFQILMIPFSRPVAKSRLLFPLDGALQGCAAADDFGGLGPNARPHTGCPQLKLLSPRSVSPL